MEEKIFNRSVCFSFFESYLDQAKQVKEQLGPEMCAEYLIAVAEYGLYQKESENPMIKMLVSGLKNVIDAGQEKRAKAFSNSEIYEEIIQYKKDHPDASLREIGEALGCSKNTVDRALKKFTNKTDQVAPKNVPRDNCGTGGTKSGTGGTEGGTACGTEDFVPENVPWDNDGTEDGTKSGTAKTAKTVKIDEKNPKNAQNDVVPVSHPNRWDGTVGQFSNFSSDSSPNSSINSSSSSYSNNNRWDGTVGQSQSAPKNSPSGESETASPEREEENFKDILVKAKIIELCRAHTKWNDITKIIKDKFNLTYNGPAIAKIDKEMSEDEKNEILLRVKLIEDQQKQDKALQRKLTHLDELMSALDNRGVMATDDEVIAKCKEFYYSNRPDKYKWSCKDLIEIVNNPHSKINDTFDSVLKEFVEIKNNYV